MLGPQALEECTPPEELTVEQVSDVPEETGQATSPKEAPNKEAPNNLPGKDPVSNEGTEEVEATPPSIGRTVPIRIPLPTEGEVLQAATAVAHPVGPCHPKLCSKEGMKYCFIDEVHAIKKIREVLRGKKDAASESVAEGGPDLHTLVQERSTLEEERAALEIAIEEMAKDLAKEKERQTELEERVQEAERDKEAVEEEYETLLDKVHKELGKMLEEENKSTTEEMHSESEGEDTTPPHLTAKRRRDFSSSSSGDETEGIEERVSNFLRDSGDINSEKGREIKSHLQSVKKTFDNEEAGRFPGAKELRPGESRNPITNDSEGETVAKTGKNVSSKVALENFSPRGENGPPSETKAREVRGEPEKNKGIFASMVERMVQGNARKRTPVPSLDEASLKRRRPGPVHTQKAQEKEP